jgi:DNA-binding MarR family transcriptional regulator
MREIGVRLGVTARNVTKLVDGLEAEGLVIRQRHPHDRRATLLRLTPRGQVVSKESLQANHAAAAQLFEPLGPADRRRLTRILRKLIDGLRTADAEAPSATA